ncbi:hypothetical protein [Desulforhabdus amnigena]|jgi:hypothetical protein|uniref:Uncharacterized protein n=1 Tax=Desulforhabdus amnigena TaxID=40218 RepID=A0A9W6D1V1_9BACT|nr:hypothetical protein [Desulforhabdus amnigena]NLJ29645.1 hypothetical protein [Deltaproteobacteria bacterium]GLI33083.1 hypothetical protein DAMNIGENAA_05160 [Desulforhabdus amnigena]
MQRRRVVERSATKRRPFLIVYAPLKFQADMGILLSFMFLWNMLGTLILLPAPARFMLVVKEKAPLDCLTKDWKY